MTVRARPRHPISGKRFTLHANDRRELDAYLHRLDTLKTELRLNIRSPEQIDHELRYLRHGHVTFEKAARAYLERPLAENTRKRVRRELDTHMRQLWPSPLTSFDAEFVGEWLDNLRRRGMHDTSVATLWRSVSAVMAFALSRGWIGATPWGHWKPKLSTEPKRVQREAARIVDELARLLDAGRVLDDRAFASRRVPAIEAKTAAAGLLGLRQGELAGLRWSDIGLGSDGPIVLVARQWQESRAKMNKRPRRLETIGELLEVLERHRARLEALDLYTPAGPVFPLMKLSRPGRPRAYASGEVLTRLNIRQAAELAQLPNVGSWSAHSLRDTFVTLEAAGAGGDLRRVASRSRHASLASLARYLRALSRDSAPPAFSLPRPTGGAVPLLERPSTHDHQKNCRRDLRGGEAAAAVQKSTRRCPRQQPLSKVQTPQK